MWVKQTDHFDKQDVVKRGQGCEAASLSTKPGRQADWTGKRSLYVS
jgi:hypothetical protein